MKDVPAIRVKLELIDLEKLAKLLHAATDALKSLGDSIAHLVRLSVQGWDAAEARLRNKRLRTMVRDYNMYSIGQMEAVRLLDDCIDRIDDEKRAVNYDYYNLAWDESMRKIEQFTMQVHQFLRELKAEKSEFVLEKSYTELAEAFSGRITLFEHLKKCLPPTTFEERAALRQAIEEWYRLGKALQRTIDTLTQYLKEETEFINEETVYIPDRSRMGKSG